MTQRTKPKRAPNKSLPSSRMAPSLPLRRKTLRENQAGRLAIAHRTRRCFPLSGDDDSVRRDEWDELIAILISTSAPKNSLDWLSSFIHSFFKLSPCSSASTSRSTPHVTPKIAGQPRRMVSFPRIPYAEAARRAGRQDRFVFGTLLAIFIVLRLVILLTFGRWRLSAWICLTLSHERSH